MTVPAPIGRSYPNPTPLNTGPSIQRSYFQPELQPILRHANFVVLSQTPPESHRTVPGEHGAAGEGCPANLCTKILDFRGFDSSRVLILRGGVLMSIGDFPESLSQAILAGRFLVGRLGVALTGVGDSPAASVPAPAAPPVRCHAIGTCVHADMYVYVQHDRVMCVIHTWCPPACLPTYLPTHLPTYLPKSACVHAA